MQCYLSILIFLNIILYESITSFKNRRLTNTKNLDEASKSLLENELKELGILISILSKSNEKLKKYMSTTTPL